MLLVVNHSSDSFIATYLHIEEDINVIVLQ